MYLTILGLIIIMNISGLFKNSRRLLNKERLKDDYEDLNNSVDELSIVGNIDSVTLTKSLLAVIYLFIFIIIGILWFLSQNYYQAQSIHFVLVLYMIYNLVDALSLPMMIRVIRENDLTTYKIISYWNLVSSIVDLVITGGLFALYYM